MYIPSSIQKSTESYSIFWFRRDLRLDDNMALFHALNASEKVLPIFIFDSNILDELNSSEDKRVNFIYETISRIKVKLENMGSSILIAYGVPLEAIEQLTEKISIKAVYTNNDYEPYAVERDQKIEELLKSKGIAFYSYKDQVIFEKDEILKKDGESYNVYTPYNRKWKSTLDKHKHLVAASSEQLIHKLAKVEPLPIPGLNQFGFVETSHGVAPSEFNQKLIVDYDKTRDIPSTEGTSKLGVHFRFGTVSIRKAISLALDWNETWLNELIWREFYMQIMHHFPQVVTKEFKEKYRYIPWRYDEDDFSRWCMGQTGYPIVDAGMRELNETGYMHNRIRMIVASFLTKHLLIDWRWGERYFAEKLLDYELASNNGNWQWVAGTGVDAVPYFRVFNPETQAKKFDPRGEYIQKWVPEIHSFAYPDPMVKHKEGCDRYLKTMRSALYGT